MTTHTPAPEGSRFQCTRNKGFHIVFDNGFCVSVQFGPSNYAGNRNLDHDQWQTYVTRYDAQSGTDKSRVAFFDVPASKTAEVAVMTEEGDWAQLGPYDEVAGYCSVSEVMTILVLAQAAKDLSTFHQAYYAAFPDRRPVPRKTKESGDE